MKFCKHNQKVAQRELLEDRFIWATKVDLLGRKIILLYTDVFNNIRTNS